MWFAFPEGIDQLSVEQQIFRPEHKDKDGRQYFRAPDHFAPAILGQTGFARVQRPEGAPEDLPKEDPRGNAALDQMATEVSALQDEVMRLRAMCNEVIQERDALKATNQTLGEELEALDKEMEALRAKVEAKPGDGDAKSNESKGKR